MNPISEKKQTDLSSWGGGVDWFIWRLFPGKQKLSGVGFWIPRKWRKLGSSDGKLMQPNKLNGCK